MTTQPEHGWLPRGTFVERLYLVRAHMGWNRKEAALACGFPISNWRSWETGNSPRDYEVVCQRIARATGCDLVWLMTGQASEQPRPDGSEAMSASRCSVPSGPVPPAVRLEMAA